MTTQAIAAPRNIKDEQVQRTLATIRRAADRVAQELSIPSGQLNPGKAGPDSADRSTKQPEGGLLRSALQRGSMLITKESSNRLAAERRSKTDDLANHVGAVLRELNTVRSETKQLLDQRRQLEVYLAALKTELETLRAEKVELMALKAEVAPHVGEAEVDLVARAKAAVANVSDTTKPAATTTAKAKKQNIAPRTATDEDAFRAFLLADVDHDKSREWFMSQTVS